ncbi:hypothetical protein HKX48_007826 [Thoreauomyces humboldtii]|nr:hypothetical protein HKX48_007826 [Thoreauomyces humboldtii]
MNAADDLGDYRRAMMLDPYASAMATLQSGDPHGLFIPDWEAGLIDEETTKYTSRELVVYAAVQFLAKAIANPFEAGTILQQVQFLPSDAYLERYRETSRLSDVETSDAEAEEAPEEDDSDDSSPEHEDDIFGSDAPRSYVQSVMDRSDEIGAADASGYLLVGHSEDEPTRAPYQLPPLEGSALATVGEIISSNNEGFSSLWKGQTPAWTHEMAHSVMQPGLETQINDLIREQESHHFMDLDTDAQTLLVKIASHSISSFILSPLDLIRTRLVVQTANPYHRKYRGPFHCLMTMIREEGWSSIYFGRHFLPSILHQTLVPAFQHAAPVVIEHLLGVIPDDSPVTYTICELAFKCVELAVTMPLETTRRRLQCQIATREPEERPFEPAVARSPLPYTGLVDCATRIVLEESGHRRKRDPKESTSGVSTPPARRRRRKSRPKKDRTWWSSWGVRGLYRGFRLRLMSSVVLVLVNSVADYLDVPDDAAQGF